MTHIPLEIFKSLRAILALSIVLSLFFVYRIYKGTLPKDKLEHITGKITYKAHTYQNNPYRDPELFQYIIIETYPNAVEFYTEAMKERKRFDNLKVGDLVTIYLTSSPSDDGINHYPKLLEKDNQIYFKKNNFEQKMALIMIGILFLLALFSYKIYKMGKIPW